MAVAELPGARLTGTPVTLPPVPLGTVSVTDSPLAPAPPLLLSARGYVAVAPVSTLGRPLLAIPRIGTCSMVGCAVTGPPVIGPVVPVAFAVALATRAEPSTACRRSR